ncbi:MAG: hypothetical protein GY857_14090 [Desulfobacula sp.]|nr:hypothetical protein [Desulfobacula sp.]
MNACLNSNNFPGSSEQLANDLQEIFQNDLTGTFYEMLGSYQRILADNTQRNQWQDINNKLLTLFKCGKSVLLDGPMIGIPLSIRDSDYFKETVQHLGQERSQIASIEWMATAWNMTFADTGLWMGKSFEPVKKDVVAKKCGNNQRVMDAYNPETTRIGRNFFRDPPKSNLFHGISLPALVQLWNLKERPLSISEKGFYGTLTQTNLDGEKRIPYSKTGGIYLSDFGHSVLPEMNGKEVYQLNYRWPQLLPIYPMTRLVDEIVQIDKGIYLGQLIYATRHYSLGSLRLPFCPDLSAIPIGEPYAPDHKHVFDFFRRDSALSDKEQDGDEKYGYQNNGYFLMMDPAHARDVYAKGAFPQLRPRPGEQGYVEMGYDTKKEHSPKSPQPIQTQWGDITNWTDDWKKNRDLKRKFTTFILEESPKKSDYDDVRQLLKSGESILQMLQRISNQISRTSMGDDRLVHFEKLNRFFRRGVAPVVDNGLFKGHGAKGYNARVKGSKKFDFYGKKDVARGFDYYHGATLNLHMGFTDTFSPDFNAVYDQSQLFPSGLASSLGDFSAGPNLLNLIWQSIGKYIFPWAGKSYEKISGRTLSMFLDESDDLAQRYPRRVQTLKSYLASAPHYNLVLKNAEHFWKDQGFHAQYLKNGSWDKGMSDADKVFWEKEAKEHWVDGNNIMDERILAADPLMQIIDMNYRTPDPLLQALSESGPSPFFRQGYKFLGTSDQDSILPMNNGENSKKKVFQFHYRYPMLGGPMPIGLCLDELVEIADGLFLGQLIYSTALNMAYHSSIDPSKFKYQLFGYFLLLDDAWQYHRMAIGLDTWNR